MLKVRGPDPAANFLEIVADIKRLSASAADRVQLASLETSGAIRAFKMGNEHGDTEGALQLSLSLEKRFLVSRLWFLVSRTALRPIG
jgi:hypothetical protein